MEVKSCKKCGKIFQYIVGAPICPKCKKDEEELFQVVKVYLRKNVGATMEEVCSETGASVKMLERYLREGRLEVMPGSPIALSCEQCGTKIHTGRLCDKCRAKLSSDLGSAAKSIRDAGLMEKETAAKMRFFNPGIRR